MTLERYAKLSIACGVLTIGAALGMAALLVADDAGAALVLGPFVTGFGALGQIARQRSGAP